MLDRLNFVLMVFRIGLWLGNAILVSMGNSVYLLKEMKFRKNE